jgi:glycosyltransferase involved in cell wall biosynthesis
VKVLLVNKFFYPRGGSEACLFLTSRVLERHGHRVVHFAMAHPDNLPSPQARHFVSRVDFDGPAGPLAGLRAAGRVVYSFEARRKLDDLIREERPDIAHLHNIHHQLSPSILHALRRGRVPVVMTLHDYKVVCPAYDMFAGGRTCERCRGGRFYHCALHRCTKGSLAKSLVNTLECYLHRDILRTQDLVDVYISPSRFLARKVAEMGFRRKAAVLPNGLEMETFVPAPGPGEEALVYFGRLSAEKGVRTLVSALAGTNVRCAILGDGPMERRLREATRGRAPSGIVFRGRLSREEVVPEVRKARAVVVPSLWFENNPYNVLEAFALARPVIASNIGGLPELVTDGRTGWTFPPGDAAALRARIEDALARPDEAERRGREGRRLVERENDAETYYRGLMGIYETALGGTG